MNGRKMKSELVADSLSLPLHGCGHWPVLLEHVSTQNLPATFPPHVRTLTGKRAGECLTRGTGKGSEVQSAVCVSNRIAPMCVQRSAPSPGITTVCLLS